MGPAPREPTRWGSRVWRALLVVSSLLSLQPPPLAPLLHPGRPPQALEELSGRRRTAHKPTGSPFLRPALAASVLSPAFVLSLAPGSLQGSWFASQQWCLPSPHRGPARFESIGLPAHLILPEALLRDGRQRPGGQGGRGQPVGSAAALTPGPASCRGPSRWMRFSDTLVSGNPDTWGFCLWSSLPPPPSGEGLPLGPLHPYLPASAAAS